LKKQEAADSGIMTYEAIVDKKTDIVIGAKLMTDARFAKLVEENGFTVYRDRFGNKMIRLVN
jgi:hypothetical protein